VNLLHSNLNITGHDFLHFTTIFRIHGTSYKCTRDRSRWLVDQTSSPPILPSIPMRLSLPIVSSLVAGAVGINQDTPVPVPACSSDIVAEISSHGLLEYILRHCVHDGASPPMTISGDDAPGPEGCLANFITESGQTSIPRGGACRESIQRLVNELYDHGTVGFAHLSLDDDDVLNIASQAFFIDATNGISSHMTVFLLENWYAVSTPQCSLDSIREGALNNEYERLVKIAATTRARYVSTPGSLSDMLCDFCYDLFSDSVGAGVNADPILKAICAENPSDASCLQSSSVQRALGFFSRCAGAPVTTISTVCSPEDMAAINTGVSPTPYYAFMFCAIVGTDICVFVDKYIEQIAGQSSTECAACFRDFFDALDSDAAVKFCDENDVYDPRCVASQTAAHIGFQACTGQFINTKPPST
jgi:hypothetical protein